ncbi:MAG: formyltetrahydrofolate deformylase [Gemmatimonadetes bacterium]|nr:MAG: formyltetrahydrofolate deformylase [Gemmatimonadota bacterium]
MTLRPADAARTSLDASRASASSEATTRLLLIDCPDEVGLVHRITGVLFRAGFSVVSNHEYVDPMRRHFFMRTAFAGDRPTDALIGELRTELPLNANVRIATTEPRRIVILATKEAHCLGDLLLRHAEGDIPAHVEAVISNYPTLGRLVERFGVPFHHVSHEGRDRAEHEAAIRDVLAAYDPEFLVLAKYMRVLSPAFVAAYPARIVNIHHSFLPAFVGARPYQQAFDRGVKIIGATAHIVTDDLDTGPIIAQDVRPVTHAHTAADMARAGRDVEKIVLAHALTLLLEERVFLSGDRAVVFE